MMTTPAKILVVEDELIIAHEIQRFLTSLSYELAQDFVDTSEDALQVLETQAIDLVLMDINIKGETDGIATALLIKEKHDLPIIFLTALSDDKTLQRAKVVEPAGYIVKPFDKNDLKVNIEIALYKAQQNAAGKVAKIENKETVELSSEKAKYFFVKKGVKFTKIAVEDILWIEALDNYVCIHTAKDDFVAYSSMKDIEQILPTQFFKSHRSFIVNLDKIDGFEDSYILISKRALPVSRANKEALKKRVLFL